jgi:NAD-dependent DNA ligase
MRTSQDEDGQPFAAFRARENTIKMLEHLIGLCRGLVCDGVLHDGEIFYLDTWLKNNSLLISGHPIGRLVTQRVERVLADGTVSEEERSELIEVLGSVIGGLGQDGGAGGLSIALTEKPQEAVSFENRSFVITGKFIYGPRRQVEQAISERAGIIHDGVTKKTNYVVLGTMGSRDWTNSSFGTKLEKVYALQEAGNPIVILSEPEWVDALN